MYHDECNKPISKKEVDNYVKNYEPLLMCKFYFDKEKTWKYVAKIYIENSPKIYLVNFHHSVNGEIILGEVNTQYAEYVLNQMSYKNKEDPFEYDLMTMYYCYSNRYSCMNINSNMQKIKC